MGGKEKEGRVGGKGKGGERMWRGPESGLPRGPCWLSAGLRPATRKPVVCPKGTPGEEAKLDHTRCECTNPARSGRGTD